MQKNILVIGAGIVGLTSALLLAKQHGHECRVYLCAEKYSPHTCSDVAGAIYGPYLCEPEDLVNEWGLASLPWFFELAQDSKHTGVKLHTGYMYFDEPLPATATSKQQVALSKCPKWLQQTPHLFDVHYVDAQSHPHLFGNATFAYAMQYTVPMMDMRILLPYLLHLCVVHGVQLVPLSAPITHDMLRNNTVHKHVCALFHMDGHLDGIVNCCGLGAQELCKDEHVVPVRGQLIEVEWQAPSNAATSSVTAWPPFFMYLSAKGSSYILPRTQNRIMLGGSFQMNNNKEQVDATLKQQIWDNCAQMIPDLHQRVTIVRDWVGLRPYRTNGVNLQVQQLQGGKTILFNNYGHGACGVSIAYGCAQYMIQNKIAKHLQLGNVAAKL